MKLCARVNVFGSSEEEEKSKKDNGNFTIYAVKLEISLRTKGINVIRKIQIRINLRVFGDVNATKNGYGFVE